MYEWLKWLHVVGVFVYAGGFLTLTRMLGKAVRYESVESRRDAYATLKRMHKFVDWGGAGLALVGGLWLLAGDPLKMEYMTKGYFHMKLTFILVLVAMDVLTSRKMFALDPEGEQPSPTFFRIAHGVVGLAILGIFLAIYIVR
jgi:uncharacterized membrane protein